MRTLVKSNRNFIPTTPSFFDDAFTRDLFNWGNANHASGDTLPAVNIYETADDYKLEVAAPGINRDDFSVELDNNKLTISASHTEQNEENGKYTRREFSYKSFKRTFNLPERMTETDKIAAQYEDGILHITIPKAEVAKEKPARSIQIS